MRFPSMSIATSVVNRILNFADGIEAQERQARPMPQPMMDDVEEQGAQLDQALAQPAPEMPALEDNPESDTANAIEPILHGGTALDGLVDSISGR